MLHESTMRSTKMKATRTGVLAITLALVLGTGGGCSGATADPPAPPAEPSPVAAVPIATPPGTPAAPPGAAPPAAAPAVAPTTARIMFITSPAVNATVTWGKTRLGVIGPKQPLVVVRPRDSGPLDVIVRAQGYLPVHTRAHTFGDSRVIVKLTAPELKNTLLGYRAPLDAGTLLPDGGVALDPLQTDPGMPTTGAGATPELPAAAPP